MEDTRLTNVDPARLEPFMTFYMIPVVSCSEYIYIWYSISEQNSGSTILIVDTHPALSLLTTRYHLHFLSWNCITFDHILVFNRPNLIFRPRTMSEHVLDERSWLPKGSNSRHSCSTSRTQFSLSPTLSSTLASFLPFFFSLSLSTLKGKWMLSILPTTGWIPSICMNKIIDYFVEQSDEMFASYSTWQDIRDQHL